LELFEFIEIKHIDLGYNKKVLDEGTENVLKELELNNNVFLGLSEFIEIKHIDLGYNKKITDEGIKNMTQL